MPTAIITGASRGLGRALAHGLAQRGWRLVIDARGANDLARVTEELSPLAGDVVAVPGDVTDESHRIALVDTAARLGGADVLVNNAGALGPSPLPDLAGLALPDLGAVFDANVAAPLRLIQLALPQLSGTAARRAGTADGHSGAIVNITSDAAVEAYPGWGAYGSSKAALEAITRVLAAEHPDLSIYTADPGDMRTAMHQSAFPGEDISDRPLPADSVPGIIRLIEERPPSGRYHTAGVRVP
ncbi:MAG: SDR family NAD(P)-dependent oxidoreductase [Acidimicrobiia bacterium]